jgi:hypothetical protein
MGTGFLCTYSGISVSTVVVVVVMGSGRGRASGNTYTTLAFISKSQKRR